MVSNYKNISYFTKNEFSCGINTDIVANTDRKALSFNNNYCGAGVSIEKPYGTFEPMVAYRLRADENLNHNVSDMFLEATYKSPKCSFLDFKIESRTRLFANNIFSGADAEYKVNERLCVAKSVDLGNDFGLYGKFGVSADFKLNKGSEVDNDKNLKISPACLLGFDKKVIETENAKSLNMYLETFPFDKSVVAGVKFKF